MIRDNQKAYLMICSMSNELEKIEIRQNISNIAAGAVAGATIILSCL